MVNEMSNFMSTGQIFHPVIRVPVLTTSAFYPGQGYHHLHVLSIHKLKVGHATPNVRQLVPLSLAFLQCDSFCELLLFVFQEKACLPLVVCLTPAFVFVLVSSKGSSWLCKYNEIHGRRVLHTLLQEFNVESMW